VPKERDIWIHTNFVGGITDGHDAPEMPSQPLVFVERCEGGADSVLVQISKDIMFVETVV